LDTHFRGAAVAGSGAVPVTRGLQTIFAKATQVLTSDNTNVADGATVTIGTTVYTFKTALTPTEGQVLIGADADGSLLNLIRAINHTGTSGTDYSVAAAHTLVAANAAVQTGHKLLITSLTDGTASNAIATTETSAHLSWAATTMSGGRAAVTTTAGDRIILQTNGASLTSPLLVELLSVIETAFSGTSPVVSIHSTLLDGTGAQTEIAIADIVTDQAPETRVITADRIYYVLYTAGTGLALAGNIYSFARVQGMGFTS
jgi:hypothetical protein